jgi:hypothetical protein
MDHRFSNTSFEQEWAEIAEEERSSQKSLLLCCLLFFLLSCLRQLNFHTCRARQKLTFARQITNGMRPPL